MEKKQVVQLQCWGRLELDLEERRKSYLLPWRTVGFLLLFICLFVCFNSLKIVLRRILTWSSFAFWSNYRGTSGISGREVFIPCDNEEFPSLCRPSSL